MLAHDDSCLFQRQHGAPHHYCNAICLLRQQYTPITNINLRTVETLKLWSIKFMPFAKTSECYSIMYWGSRGWGGMVISMKYLYTFVFDVADWLHHLDTFYMDRNRNWEMEIDRSFIGLREDIEKWIKIVEFITRQILTFCVFRVCLNST